MLQPLAHARDIAAWLTPRCTGTLRTDHRQVRPGDALLAWPGRRTDAREHVQQALAAGAAACVVEAEGMQRFGFDDPRIAALASLRRHAGEVADVFFGAPSAAMAGVAVTGTNGKTSCTWWLAQALATLGRRCGVIGTLGMGAWSGPPATAPEGATPCPELQPTGLTTPDAVALHHGLRQMADAGVQAFAVEASSIGLEEHRLVGVRLAVAAFTNFSRDHLDYHGSMAAYWAAKRKLFDWPGLRAAVVNVDDPCGLRLAQELSARGDALRVWTVSAHSASGPSDVQALEVGQEPSGLRFTLAEGGARLPIRAPLIGEFNVYNLLVVAGCLRALDVPLPAVAMALQALQPVPGRLQRIAASAAAGAPEVVVDYAHTPDALEKVLRALAPVATARGGRLWCVFGCGGNRDATKRPLMGDVAARLAHEAVVTSDNPRDEPARLIIEQVLAGMAPVARERAFAIEDRQAAIAFAIDRARDEDVVLVAGKGHEDTQEIAGVKRPFVDAAQALTALRARQVRAVAA